MKDFFKSVSIYGILPVVGKFTGFFLIPIYASFFSAFQFGILEILMSFVGAITLLVNAELYSAIGRFFYEKKIEERIKMISSGFWLTILLSVVIISFLILGKETILQLIFKEVIYEKEYIVACFWIFFYALSTYLSVIPRFEKNQKSFIIISLIQIFVRFLLCLLFIIVFKLNIIGVLYAFLIGDMVAMILYGFLSRKYLQCTFSKSLSWEILKYAAPIVPATIIFGAYAFFSKTMIAANFSIATVGYLAFAMRITSIIDLIKGATKLGFQPYVFENYKKNEFKENIQKISYTSSFLLLLGAIACTLFSPEIISLFGRGNYQKSVIFIGFLFISQILTVLYELRGYGPEVTKKTYILSIGELFSKTIGLIALFLLNETHAYIMLGLALILPNLLLYIIRVGSTQTLLKINFHSIKEVLLFILLIISSLVIYYFNEDMIIIRVLFFVGCLSVFYIIRPFRSLKLNTIIKRKNDS
jgi:O-antigen/teichoic acid export membrane protein